MFECGSWSWEIMRAIAPQSLTKSGPGRTRWGPYPAAVACGVVWSPSGLAGLVALALHGGVEGLVVHAHALGAERVLGQVEGEAVGVV